MLDGEPFRPGQVKALVRAVLAHGEVMYSRPHAYERLEKHAMTIVDVANVLQGGRAGEGEWENGGWRYQLYSNKFVVVIEFLDENTLMVVTAWRLS